MEISNVCYYDAKITKLDSWKQHNVYREVPYHGQHLISQYLLRFHGVIYNNNNNNNNNNNKGQ